MSVEEHQELYLKGIIEGYRNAVWQRYQFENVKNYYKLPPSIDEDTVTQLREYFLNYLYPSYDEREALNDAFESLDDYTKHPKKLLRVALDAAKLFFKYGRHLPRILSSGLNAMNTFKAATTFEANLVEAAIVNKLSPPYNNDDIDALIKTLSRNKIETFIESSQSLFKLLHDKILIEKIKVVIQYLITSMKNNNTAYSQSQIKGLELGLEMIVEGDAIFRQLSEDDQQKLIDTITKIERDNLNRIFLKS